MGVTGLWTVLHPCARPTKLSTLTDKRLAIDASIWIYQFVKAMRNKEGEALRAAHITGFFRRICKLLFLGIRPVFVFDGSVPDLKRRTIAARKNRREGYRDSAKRTAERLLVTQLHRAVREQTDDAKRKRRRSVDSDATATPKSNSAAPDNRSHPSEPVIYASELFMSPSQRLQARGESFRAEDKYHLPDMPASMSEMAGPADPRVMSLAELEAYAREFETEGGDEAQVGIYDLSQIDFDGHLFRSLPVTDQYKILSAARLRSRLRIGLSKDQLDSIFPDRMAFSKFQIDRVKERNELTQRLMLLAGMTDQATYQAATGAGGRIASEKGREYVLVKNEGVEGGWALGVVGAARRHGFEFNQGSRSRPIDLEAEKDGATRESATDRTTEDDEDEDDTEFEDVPIEGLNRLPRNLLVSPANRANAQHHAEAVQRFAVQRQALYQMRQQQKQQSFTPKTFPYAQRQLSSSPPPFAFEEADPEQESMFIQDADDRTSQNDESLQRALALSLQETRADRVTDRSQRYSSPFEPEIDEVNEVAVQQAISLSLQNVQAGTARKRDRSNGASSDADIESDQDDYEEVFHAQNKPERPWASGTKILRDGLKIAQAANMRSRMAAMAEDEEGLVEVRSRPVQPVEPDDEEGDDFHQALRASRKEQGDTVKVNLNRAFETSEDKPRAGIENQRERKNENSLLPFANLNLGMSLLGKRGSADKSKEKEPEPKAKYEPIDSFTGPTDVEEEEYEAGGFVAAGSKDSETEKAEAEAQELQAEKAKKKKLAELPLWFQTDRDPVHKSGSFGGDTSKQTANSADSTPAYTSAEETKAHDISFVFQTPPNIREEISLNDSPIPVQNQTKVKIEGHTNASMGWSDGKLESEPQDEFEDVVIMKLKDEGAVKNEAGMSFSFTRPSGTGSSGSPDEATHEVSTPRMPAKSIGGRTFFTPESAAAVATPKPALKSAQSTPKSRLNPRVTFTPEAAADPARLETLVEPKLATRGDDNGEYNVDEDDAEDAELERQHDEELLEQMAQESEEHVRFTAELATASALDNHPAQMIADLESEIDQLRAQRRKNLRDADDVTQTMISECQELLTLFGLPYITAPTEAEAQCAELLRLGLVDGIVTDDSDTFLFGGSCVYKNMFNQSRFVECFLTRDFVAEFGLDRKKLIDMAILLGSDYTEGLRGVGPVTALEIVSEFDSLKAFGSWWSEAQMKPLIASMNSPKSSASPDPLFSTKFRRQFHRAHAAKLFLPPNFPDPAVEEAYRHPRVDSDPTSFVWGVPNLDQLRMFLSATIGWSAGKTDEVLVPVIQEMNKRQLQGRQSNITRFLEPMGVPTDGTGSGKRKRPSRMESALGKMRDRKRRKEIEEMEAAGAELDDVDLAEVGL